MVRPYAYSTTVNVLFSAIQRLAPPDSVYAKNAKLYEIRLTQLDGMALAVDPLRGILQALRNDYQSGYLQSVVELVHADIFSDFLEMADYRIIYYSRSIKIQRQLLSARFLRSICGNSVTNTEFL
jgi:hypothetical protein